VGNIKTGEPVTFKVDAFPGAVFHGVVSQVRMNPTTIQNVVTYDTIIAFDNPELKLFPGMTAYVTIPVATVSDVLKVPNTALRYKPPISLEEIQAIYARYGLEASAVDGAPAGGGKRTPSSPAADAPNAPRAPARKEAVVWKLVRGDNSMEPVRISLGITDHSYTQVASVLKGTLREGDELITRSVMAKSQAPAGIRR
jgi:HlyD family secretion protein